MKFDLYFINFLKGSSKQNSFGGQDIRGKILMVKMLAQLGINIIYLDRQSKKKCFLTREGK